MWKREEPVRSSTTLTGEGAVAESPAQVDPGQKIRGAGGPLGRDVVNIGKLLIHQG